MLNPTSLQGRLTQPLLTLRLPCPHRLAFQSPHLSIRQLHHWPTKRLSNGPRPSRGTLRGWQMQRADSTTVPNSLRKPCVTLGHMTGRQVRQLLRVPRGDKGDRGLVAHVDRATPGPGVTRGKHGCIFYFSFGVKTYRVTADYSVFTRVWHMCLLSFGV